MGARTQAPAGLGTCLGSEGAKRLRLAARVPRNSQTLHVGARPGSGLRRGARAPPGPLQPSAAGMDQQRDPPSACQVSPARGVRGPTGAAPGCRPAAGPRPPAGHPGVGRAGLGAQVRRHRPRAAPTPLSRHSHSWERVFSFLLPPSLCVSGCPTPCFFPKRAAPRGAGVSGLLIIPNSNNCPPPAAVRVSTALCGCSGAFPGGSRS